MSWASTLSGSSSRGLKVPLIFKSRPHAPQPSQGRARGDDERPRLYGGPMASVKQIQVTFDCAEPERVARFWCEVLGYVVPPPPEGFATWDDFDRALPPERRVQRSACIDPSGAGPRLFFPSAFPKARSSRTGCILTCGSARGLVGEERLAALEAECARLVALGAVTRAATACRWRQRVVPRDAGHRGQRVLSRLSGRERGTLADRLVQFAITRVAVSRGAPTVLIQNPPLGVHGARISRGDRREHPLMPLA